MWNDAIIMSCDSLTIGGNALQSLLVKNVKDRYINSRLKGGRSNLVLSPQKGRFPFKKKIGKFLLEILGISVWEESVPFVTSPIRLQAPLRRFTKKPDALVNCSTFCSNASLFVAFPYICMFPSFYV